MTCMNEIPSPSRNPHIIATKGIRYVTNDANKASDFLTSLVKRKIASAEPKTDKVAIAPNDGRTLASVKVT